MQRLGIGQVIFWPNRVTFGSGLRLAPKSPSALALTANSSNAPNSMYLVFISLFNELANAKNDVG
jgi:hypothetical protein